MNDRISFDIFKFNCISPKIFSITSLNCLNVSVANYSLLLLKLSSKFFKISSKHFFLFLQIRKNKYW